MTLEWSFWGTSVFTVFLAEQRDRLEEGEMESLENGTKLQNYPLSLIRLFISFFLSGVRQGMIKTTGGNGTHPTPDRRPGGFPPWAQRLFISLSRGGSITWCNSEQELSESSFGDIVVWAQISKSHLAMILGKYSKICSWKSNYQHSQNLNKWHFRAQWWKLKYGEKLEQVACSMFKGTRDNLKQDKCARWTTVTEVVWMILGLSMPLAGGAYRRDGG